jgi:hypothetical protein
MQDEEIDKLINDAASQHHPPYDDKAWGKMEELLDQHLPVQKDRRRLVFFILFFLLLGGAIGVAIVQPWKTSGSVAAAPGENTNAAVAQLKPGTTGNDANNTTGQPVANTNTATAAIPFQQNSSTTVATGTHVKGAAGSVAQQYGVPDEGEQLTKGKNISYHQKARTSVKIKNAAATGDDAEENKSTTAKKSTAPDEDNAAVVEPAVTDIAGKSTDTKVDAQKPVAVTTTVAEPAAATKPDATAAKKNEPSSTKSKKNTDKSFANNFALTFSTGADLSYIDISNAGKMQVFYGAGATYTLGKHFRIASGIYVSKKVYTAMPYQYKFPGGAYYPNLQSINADCKVYEIPLSLYYGFAAAKKHQWFTGLGISSLLMKKETYDYLYQTPGGQSYSYAKTITNENKHYFSVVTLSGGYQYNLNSRLSLIAEPYLKLPLSGVGAGKIKLNSTGLLLSAVIKPFGKGKK